MPGPHTFVPAVEGEMRSGEGASARYSAALGVAAIDPVLDIL
jgi:hypothetical protein